jgi:uncharacterized membrane protein/osmotically-inducible protein OsmY
MTQWLNWINLSGAKRRQRNRSRIDSGMRALGYLGLGAGLMYLLDPDRGRRRRALARDRMKHTVNVLGGATKITARDLSHRVHGLLADGGHLFRNQEVSDETLEARVRSKLGRLISHPHAIAVAVDHGRVALSGPVPADEVAILLKSVSKIPGVRVVKDALMAHIRTDDAPGMQSARPRARSRTNWTPTKRLFACAAGGALMGYCLKRRDLPFSMSTGMGVLGFGLVARALTNLETKRLIGVGAGDAAVMAQKTININAPVERVYEFFTKCQNFPRFMTNVREVRQTGTGRSRWTVAGPMGMPVKWTAQITENIPNQRIAWATMPGSLVKSSGTIQFRPNQNGATQVEIKLLYNPIAGAMGHALARFFGADPKSEMDADLLRMKTMIETGHAPHDAAAPRPALIAQSGR